MLNDEAESSCKMLRPDPTAPGSFPFSEPSPRGGRSSEGEPTPACHQPISRLVEERGDVKRQSGRK